MEKEITLQEASKRYGQDRTTLYRWVKAGTVKGREYLKGSRISYLVDVASLEDHLSYIKEGASGQSIDQLVEEWKKEQASGFLTGRPIGQARIEAHKYGLQNYWMILKKPKALGNFSAENLRTVLSSFEVDYINKIDHFATKEGIHKAALSFTKMLVRRGLKPKQILTDIAELKPERVFPPRKTVLEENQLQILLELNDKWTNGRSAFDRELTRTLVILFAFAGLRRKEAMNLAMGHLDFENKILHVIDGKGHKNRMIGMCPELIDQLNRWIDHYRPESPFNKVLLNDKGMPLSKEVINHRIQSLKLKAQKEKHSIDITPHGLRRTFATLMENRGMPLSLLRISLGHTDITTTQGYLMSEEKHAVEWLKNLGQKPAPVAAADLAATQQDPKQIFQALVEILKQKVN
jgi:integrase/recombinase XerD